MGQVRSALTRVRNYFEDRRLNDLQEVAFDAHGAINGLPFGNGAKASASFDIGQTKKIAHRLGRKPTGVIPLLVTGNYGVFYVVTSDERTISIRSQNFCSASFWVF